ncbi:hypothetical protein AAY80_185 [Stenotrophomonas phage vB_SmaS-DLP_6]|nr:hypothetical protein AAY80_185 [Stenotrophomonas phage vB_SmaS-DLP_6]
MFAAVWLLGAVLFWSIAGFILYKIAEDEGEDFLMKHMIIGIAVVFVGGLIPILNIVGIIGAICIIITAVMEDDDGEHWWNKPAVKKSK